MDTKQICNYKVSFQKNKGFIDKIEPFCILLKKILLVTIKIVINDGK